MYINDIVEDTESVIKLFADDASMYLFLENPHVRAEILNNDLDKIMQLANKWKLEFNERKSELMNNTNPPLFFYNGSQKAQIIHCKLRLGMSDLSYDLLNRHITRNSSCDCGERKETSEQYILRCPRFTHVKTPHRLHCPIRSFCHGMTNSTKQLLA